MYIYIHIYTKLFIVFGPISISFVSLEWLGYAHRTNVKVVWLAGGSTII